MDRILYLMLARIDFCQTLAGNKSTQLQWGTIAYLSARGIPYGEAERLIVEGFFDPIMQRIPFDGVRERFQKAILEKMGVKAL